MKSFDGAAERHLLVTRNDDLYEAFPDLVLLDDGTVLCLYRESDAHAPAWSRVALIESNDRGRSWHGHRIVLDAPSRPHWNLPRISALRDGRLVVIGDRGYDNFLIWSADRGRTWSEPQPTPIRGQCPDQVVELDDGTLLVTVEREKPGSTERCFRPPLLHLVQYRSEDQGATWQEDGVIWDTDVLGGSGEGATVQLPDDTLVCHIRNSNGYSHPSPKIFSKDRGRTWSKPVLSGTYGGMHRCGLLHDGRMLATYRQMSGNSSLYAWCGDPCEPGAYRVSSRWGDDGCAALTPEGLRIRCTGAPEEVPPAYFLPPPEHHDSVVTIEVELRCLSNEARAGWKHACAINVTDAGELVFFPDRIEIGGQPDTVRRLDATRWHRYRVVRDAASLTVSVDGDRVMRSAQLTRTGGRRFGQWGQDRTAFGATFRAAQHMADGVGRQRVALGQLRPPRLRRRQHLALGERRGAQRHHPRPELELGRGRRGVPGPVSARHHGGGGLGPDRRLRRLLLGAVSRRRDPLRLLHRRGIALPAPLPEGLPALSQRLPAPGGVMNKEVAEYAHLPPHPMEPFLRIVGVAISRPTEAGGRCPWGIAFHVVFPHSPRPYRAVRARIYENGRDAPLLELPEQIYPRGPCVAHTELFDSRVLVDREVGEVFDVHTLPPGRYRAEAELVDARGTAVGSDALAFEVGALPFLKHRIPLVADHWQRQPRMARYLAGFALVGDVDGDGESEYLNVAGAVHLSAYRSSGELIWRYDDPDGALGYGSNSLLWDADGDGRAEVYCVRGALGHIRLCKLEGATGRLLREVEYPVINSLQPVAPDARDLRARLFRSGHLIRTVEGLHMIGGYVRPADFQGQGRRADLLVQAGEQNCVTLAAFDCELRPLWQHTCDNGRAGHDPALFDADGDGRQEVAVGTELLDHDGRVLWELPFETFAAPWEDDHVDMSAGGDLAGDGGAQIAYSSRLVLDARSGERLWIDPTWHGQNVIAARLRADLPGLQLVFGDREYRHSRHFIHGEWTDVRDHRGGRLWDRRFMSMHGPHVIDWLPGALQQVTCCSDLQRFAPNPNCQVFDGHGVLVDVVPTEVPNEASYLLYPRGEITQQPYTPHPHGTIDVYACGRTE